jgi:hypothetical protein
MEWIMQIALHTPPWVWVLLAFLIWRGIKARSAADIPPAKLVPIPAVFTVWGLYDVFFAHPVTALGVAGWIAGLVVGVALGYAMLRNAPITADRARGIIHRPGDPTVLPTVVVAFLLKYCFAVAHSIAPQTMALAQWRGLEVIVSGLLAGIFLGKFVRYMRVYLA